MGGSDGICKSTKQCKSSLKSLPYILYYCKTEWFQGSCICEEAKYTLGQFVQNTHSATAVGYIGLLFKCYNMDSNQNLSMARFSVIYGLKILALLRRGGGGF